MPRKKTETAAEPAPEELVLETPMYEGEDGLELNAASHNTEDMFGLDGPADEGEDLFGPNNPILEAEDESGETADDDGSNPIRQNLWERRRQREEYVETKQEQQESRLRNARYSTAFRRGTILQGVVGSVECDRKTAYWVCYDENAIIRIPCSDTFENLTDELMADGNLENKQSFLSRSLGATISYIITDMKYNEEKDFFDISASRVQALRKIRPRYFGPTASKPLKVGQIVKATVVAAGDFACYVNLYGVDTRIAQHNITYRYVRNVAVSFRPGTTIDVMILAIDGTADSPNVVVSGARVERAKFKSRLYRITPGMTTTATVKSIRFNKLSDPPVLNIAMYLDQLGLPAYSNTIQTSLENVIHSGDVVEVKVIGVSKESDHVRVRIFWRE